MPENGNYTDTRISIQKAFMANTLQEIKNFALQELAELFMALAHLNDLPIAPSVRYRMYITQEYALYEAVGHLIKEFVNAELKANPPNTPTTEFLYATGQASCHLMQNGKIKGKPITNGEAARANSLSGIFFAFRYAASYLGVRYDPTKIEGYEAMLKYREVRDRLTRPNSIAAFKVTAAALTHFDKRIFWLTDSLHTLLPPQPDLLHVSAGQGELML